MRTIKALLFGSDWTAKNKIEKIKDIQDIRFNERVNWGQWTMSIPVDEKFDTDRFTRGDIVTVSIFDENNKSGFFRYSWVIKKINRWFNIDEGQRVSVELEWLVTLLSDFTIAKNYTWPINVVMNTFISDFHAQRNISTPIEWIGSNLFTNTITDTTSVNVDVDGTFFEALKKILEWKDFFIDQTGNISLISENNTKRGLTMNKDIYDVDIQDGWETNIILVDYADIQVWNKIVIKNIWSSVNMDNERVKELSYWLSRITVSIWEVQFF